MAAPSARNVTGQRIEKAELTRRLGWQCRKWIALGWHHDLRPA